LTEEFKTAPFASYAGNEPYAFVSYSHINKKLVFPLIKQLHEMGYRLWYDEGIDPGTEWADNIEKNLKKASSMLLFITSQSIVSDNVKDEIHYAIDEKIPIVPIFLQEIELDGGLKLRLRRYQWVHYFTYPNDEKFFEELLRSPYLMNCLGLPPHKITPVSKKTTEPVDPEAKAGNESGAKRPSKLKTFYLSKSKKAWAMMTIGVALVLLVSVGFIVNNLLQEKAKTTDADGYTGPAFTSGWDEDDEYDDAITFPVTVRYEADPSFQAVAPDPSVSRMSSHKAHGQIVADGGWVYYIYRGNYYSDADRAEVSTLHRIKLDGKGDERLSETKTIYFDIMDGWIYFVPENVPAYSDLPAYILPLCRMRTDGTEEAVIAEDWVRSFQVFNGMVYYYEMGTDDLHSMKPDGSGEKVVCRSCRGYFLTTDYIYYIKYSNMGTHIYRCRLDGSEDTRFYSSSVPEFSLQAQGDGLVFYRDENYVIHAIKRDTVTTNRVAAPDVTNGDFVMDNEWLYYVSASEKYSLYKIRLDGTDRTQVSSGVFDRIALFDGWIYFLGEGDNATDFSLYRMRTDGTGKELIKKMEVLRPAISTGY